MRVAIRQIGNSRGVVIPKTFLDQLGLSGESSLDLKIVSDMLVLRKPVDPVREGWAEAARKIAESEEDLGW